MKKYLLICLVLIIVLLFIGLNPANASKFLEGLTATGSKAYPGATTSLTDVIANVVKGLLALVGIIFVALIIYGGFNYLTSGGSEEKIKKGKNTLKAAIIGLVIIITSYTITYFIAGALESPGQTPGSAYKSACEDSTNKEYVSLNCCEYRFQSHNLVDSFCCSVYSDFCNNHKDACATQNVTCPSS